MAFFGRDRDDFEHLSSYLGDPAKKSMSLSSQPSDTDATVKEQDDTEKQLEELKKELRQIKSDKFQMSALINIMGRRISALEDAAKHGEANHPKAAVSISHKRQGEMSENPRTKRRANVTLCSLDDGVTWHATTADLPEALENLETSSAMQSANPTASADAEKWKKGRMAEVTALQERPMASHRLAPTPTYPFELELKKRLVALAEKHEDLTKTYDDRMKIRDEEGYDPRTDSYMQRSVGNAILRNHRSLQAPSSSTYPSYKSYTSPLGAANLSPPLETPAPTTNYPHSFEAAKDDASKRPGSGPHGF
ncbi:hypothetical protein GGR53DRAFT_526470 [Hypoxylon sp. FL1150]|nr:hypothetical protein GGR53DRAFT_526470 [Hypoxylon sp. FL1150]